MESAGKLQTVSSSIARLPRSTLFAVIQAHAGTYVVNSVPVPSWVDLTATENVLDSTNSNLAPGVFLIFDSVTESLALVTDNSQSIQFLGSDDVEYLQFGTLQIILISRKTSSLLT